MTNLHNDEIDQCTSKEPEEAVPKDKHSKALKKKGGRPRKEDLMQDDSEELSLEAKLKRDKRRKDNLLAAARYRHKKDERINELRKGNEQLTRRLKALSKAFAESYAIIRELRHEIARVESIYKRVAEENIDVRTELDKVTQSELNSSERMPDEMDTEQSSSSTPPHTAQPSHESMSPSGSTSTERCEKPAKGVVVIPATAMMRNFLLQNPSRSILQLPSAIPVPSEVALQPSRLDHPSCPPHLSSALDVRIQKQKGQRQERSDQLQSQQQKIDKVTILSQISANSSLSGPSSSPPSSPPRLMPSLNDPANDAASPSRTTEPSLSTSSPPAEQHDVDSYQNTTVAQKSPERVRRKRPTLQQISKQHRIRTISEPYNKTTAASHLIRPALTTPDYPSLSDEPTTVFLNARQQSHFIPILPNILRQRTYSAQLTGTPPQLQTSLNADATINSVTQPPHSASYQPAETLQSQLHCKYSPCCDSILQGHLKLPIRRYGPAFNMFTTSSSAHDADDVLSFLRRDQPNPYSRFSVHRRGRPRLDDCYRTAH